MRVPANRLFDSACELLIASRTLAAELTGPGRESVLAATFGCLEDSLCELARALADLREELLAGGGPGERGLAPLADALEELTRGLAQTEQACASAREAAGTLRGAR